MSRTRRVLLQRPAGADEFGTRHGTTSGSFEAWMRRRELELAHGDRVHPIVRLMEDGGVDWGTEPRTGDEIGYGMDPYRWDDCLEAAIATATQMPIEQVPNLQVDQRWRQIRDSDRVTREIWKRVGRWAAKRGRVLTFWAPQDCPPPRDRWIAVVRPHLKPGHEAPEDTGGFDDHCLVMSRDSLIFDPSCSVKAPPGMRLLTAGYKPGRLSYGISFEEIDNEEE